MIFDSINVIYINLDERTDRRVNAEKEFKKIGIDSPTRFKAIKLANDALGCSMSHLKCLDLAKTNNFDNILICEDDIEFLDPELFLSQLKKFMESNDRWDVVLIAGNNMIPYAPVNETCIKIYNCQTTTGYIVKKSYYDTLIQNYKEGISKLLKDPTNNDYKIDKYWLNLQRIHKWYLIIPLTIVQREDYSDIEKKVTNFKTYMLNYNKAYKK